VNRFLLTLRSNARTDHEQEIGAAKEEALNALCVLISHLKSCYALDRDRAA
jgi:hypothetical protein